MSRIIDDRVVNMEFDNDRFERNISTTLSSLDKLQKSLDFSNSKRNIQDFTKAAHEFNLGGIGDAVDGISKKFLALSTVAITTLATITAQAVHAGERILSAFSLRPTLDGFREYETNIGSIQTILANTDSKGTTLKDVNAALDELNEYADQTIYNFSQMARNIGTFTAAGVGLKESTAAIKGIANLAAISGSNAEQASTAMYQLSQALASGKVTLMDWNSVVNAGMGGEVFQKALFETGKAMGTLKDVPLGQTFDEWKKAGHTFRNSLQDEWLTAEVLTKTLQGFTGDMTEAQLVGLGYSKAQAQEFLRLGKLGKGAATEVKTLTQLISTVKEAIGSGWATSFRTIVGDFDEAKKLFTDISNGVGKFVTESAEARNHLLQGWKDLGGRTILINAFKDAIKGIGTIVKPIQQAFKDIFPSATAKTLVNLTKGFAHFTSTIKIGAETAKNLRNTFGGIFSVVRIVLEVLKGAAGLIRTVFRSFEGSGTGILEFTGALGKLLKSLKVFLVGGKVITTFFSRLGQIIKVAIAGLVTIIKPIREAFRQIFPASTVRNFGLITELLGKITDILGRLAQKIAVSAETADKIKRTFAGLFAALEIGWEIIKGLARAIVDVIESLFDNATGPIGSVLDTILTFTAKVGDALVKLNEKLVNGKGIEDFFKQVAEALAHPSENLGKLVEAFKKLFEMLDISPQKVDAFEGAFQRFSDRFGGLTKIADEVSKGWDGFIKVFDRVKDVLDKVWVEVKFWFDDLKNRIKNMWGPGDFDTAVDAVNVGLLGGILIAIKKLLKDGGALGSLKDIATGFKGILDSVTGALKAMQTEIKARALQKIAVAVAILAGALLVLSLIDSAALTKALVAMSVGFTEMVTTMVALEKLMGSTKAPTLVALATAMILLATAMSILSVAIKNLSTLDWEELAKGLVGVAGGLAVLVAATQLIPSNTAGLISAGIGMIGISTALVILSKAVKGFGEMKWDVMKQGLIGMALALTALVVAVNFIPAPQMLAAGLAMIPLAIGLNILAGAVAIFGNMDLDALKQGLAGVALALAIVAATMYLMPVTLPITAAGLLIVAAALTVLAGVLGLIGTMKPETLQRSIVAIAALMTTLALSLNLMTGTIAGAAALIIAAGALVVLAGVLKTLGSMNLKQLATGLAAIAGVLVLIGVAAAILGGPLLPEMLGLGAALLLIGAGFALFGAAVFLVAKGLEALAKSGVAGTKAIIEMVKLIIAAGPVIFAALIKALGQFIGEIAGALALIVRMLKELLLSLLDLIIEVAPKLAEAMGALLMSGLKVLNDHAPTIIATGLKILLDLLKGIADNMYKLTEQSVRIITELLRALGDNSKKMTDAGADLIIKFINGLADTIREKTPEIQKASFKIGEALADGMTGGLYSKQKDVLGGVGGMAGGVIDKVKGIFGTHSPSRVFFGIGQNLMIGLGMGIRDTSVGAQRDVVASAEHIVRAFSETLGQMPGLLDGMADINPVISPVLDLTKVEQAAKGLNGLMKVAPISPEVSLETARLISASTATNAEEADVDSEAVAPAPISFTQINNSPTALTTNDIYRNTRSQIALAKEKLGVP